MQYLKAVQSSTAIMQSFASIRIEQIISPAKSAATLLQPTTCCITTSRKHTKGWEIFCVLFYVYLKDKSNLSILASTSPDARQPVPAKSKAALSRWKKLTGTAMFINRLGKVSSAS